MTMSLVQKCNLSQSLSESVCLPLPFSLSLFVSYIHEHTPRERQNIFISLLYAGCAHEIAGLTPRCELCGGNVYQNPTVHAINLFLDQRQTGMSLYEGNKDRNTYPGPS